MVIWNCSLPPRARISSTVRAPAIPFPITTSFCFSVITQSPEIRYPAQPKSPSYWEQLTKPQCGYRDGGLPPPQAALNRSFGANREVTHGCAIAGQDQVNQFGRSVAGAKVNRLRP